jgi:hypothetical protein
MTLLREHAEVRLYPKCGSQERDTRESVFPAAAQLSTVQNLAQQLLLCKRLGYMEARKVFLGAIREGV